jgi:hypothetical protein
MALCQYQEAVMSRMDFESIHNFYERPVFEAVAALAQKMGNRKIWLISPSKSNEPFAITQRNSWVLLIG